MPVSQSDKGRLIAVARGLCQFPDCGTQCYVRTESKDNDFLTIGHVAHIVSQSDDGPRADPLLPTKEKDAYSNLLLMCPSHHRIIDGDIVQYTVGILHGWKGRHEERYEADILRAEFTFAELEVVIQGIASRGGAEYLSVSVTPLRNKMTLNGLTRTVDEYFKGGLLRVDTVEEYIKDMSGVDAALVGRLIRGFVEEYERLKSEGLKGDSLFMALNVFSAQGHIDYAYQSAGLAVLVYMFERCEVFERVQYVDPSA